MTLMPIWDNNKAILEEVQMDGMLSNIINDTSNGVPISPSYNYHYNVLKNFSVMIGNTRSPIILVWNHQMWF